MSELPYHTEFDIESPSRYEELLKDAEQVILNIGGHIATKDEMETIVNKIADAVSQKGKVIICIDSITINGENPI